MAVQDITKPMALDETLQSTNTALGTQNGKLDDIKTAIQGIGLSNIGNLASLTTTDKSSLVGAVNELVGDIGDLDTNKADKVSGATNGNLAGLNGSGNPTDSGISGDMTTTSATGNPISIADLKSAQIALNPVITFEPIQAGSGTPSPSNIRAISGYDKIEVSSCSVNLNDKSTKTKQIITDTGEIQNNASENLYDYICISESKNYVISAKNTDSSAKRIRISYFDANKTFIVRKFTDISANTTGSYDVKSDTVLFGIPSGCKYIRINHADGISEIMFYEGLGVFAYVPYHKTTDLSESLGQTVYGGTLDVRTGKLTVDRTIVDMGDLTYTYNSQYQYFYSEISSMTDSGYGLSDRYQITTASYDGNQPDNTFKMSGTGNKRIFITNRAYNNATTFKTAMVGAKIVYELATPFTIQLTPHEISLSQDYAYISTNGTLIALDYHNGEMASLSDVAQVGETINELGEYIGENDFGQIVSIKTYTSSNMYVFPSDGYLYIRCNASGSKLFVVIQGAKASTGIYIELEYGTQASSTSLFVKKGMRTYVYSGTGDYSYSFVPLV